MAEFKKPINRKHDDLLEYIYDKGYTQKEVAKWLGISRVGLQYKFKYAAPFTVGQALVIKNRLSMSWVDFERFFDNKEDIMECQKPYDEYKRESEEC